MAMLMNISMLMPNISIMGLFTFIYIAKQLRDNILLPQPAEEPEDNAPEILQKKCWGETDPHPDSPSGHEV